MRLERAVGDHRPEGSLVGLHGALEILIGVDREIQPWFIEESTPLFMSAQRSR